MDKSSFVVAAVITVGVGSVAALAVLSTIYMPDGETAAAMAIKSRAGVTRIPDNYKPKKLLDVQSKLGAEELYAILPVGRNSKSPEQHNATGFFIWGHASLYPHDFEWVLNNAKLWPPIGELAQESAITLGVGGRELPAIREEFTSGHGEYVRYRCKLRSGPGQFGTWLIAYGPCQDFDEQAFEAILSSVSFDDAKPWEVPFKTSQWGRFGEWEAAKTAGTYLLVFAIVIPLLYFVPPVVLPLAQDKTGYLAWAIFSFRIIAVTAAILSVGLVYQILRAVF